MEKEENDEQKVTNAKVKFIDDGNVTCLDIDDIIEFKDHPPINKKDFDPKKIYLTSIENDDGEEEIVGVQIDDLACGLDELNKLLKKRRHFAPLELSALQEYDTKKKELKAGCVHTDMKNKKADDKQERAYEKQKKNSEEKIKSKEIAAKAAAAEQKAQEEIFKEKMKNFINRGDEVLKVQVDSGSTEVAEEQAKNDCDSQPNEYTASNEKCKSPFSSVTSTPKKAKNDCDTDLKESIQKDDMINNDNPVQSTSSSNQFEKMNEQNEYAASNEKSKSPCSSVTSTPKKANNDSDTYLNESIEKDDMINKDNPVQCTSSSNQFEKMNEKINELRYKYEIMRAKFESLEESNKQLLKKLKRYEREDTIVVAGSSKSSDVGYGTESENNKLVTSTPKKSSDISDSELSIEDYRIINKKNKKYKKRLFSSEESEGTNLKKAKLETNKDGNGFRDVIIKKIDGKKVEMINLGNGVYIRHEDWKKAYNNPTVSLFTKEIVRSLYSPVELSQRSVSGDPTCLTPNGQQSRKQMSPQKHICIKRSVLYYILKKTTLKKDSEEYEKEINRINHYITEVINDTIKKIRKEKGITLPAKLKKKTIEVNEMKENADKNSKKENSCEKPDEKVVEKNMENDQDND